MVALHEEVQRTGSDNETASTNLSDRLDGSIAVALLLAAIGLYGVLHYSVLEQEREIGIRLALGARAVHIVSRVTSGIAVTVVAGTALGVALGFGSTRYVQALLYGVKATDVTMVMIPLTTITAAVLLAAGPALRRAMRVDPVEMLRSE